MHIENTLYSLHLKHNKVDSDILGCIHYSIVEQKAKNAKLIIVTSENENKFYI